MPTVPPFRPEPFIPRRRVRGGHAQTLAAWAVDRRIVLPPPEDRIFSVGPDAQVLCRCHWQPAGAEDPRLTLVLVHGLEGSSESQYMIGAARKGLEAGFHVVRMNMRNCGGTERLSRTLYHSGLSGDVGAVAAAIAGDPRVSRLALAGFSMGANLVLKLAGEWGTAPPANVAGVAAVSAALDLAPSADALHAPGNRMYEWNFMRALRRSIRRKAELFPELYGTAQLRGLRTIRQFDDVITARFCGFADADDYYRQSSASRLVDRIGLPALVIYSHDDPFIRVLPQTREKLRRNPNITLLDTTHGGHCAFLASPNGYDGRWAERQLVEFFRRFA